jgi:hypothetical protein
MTQIAQSNAIAVSIPDQDLTEIRASIAKLRSKLLPHPHTLSAQGLYPITEALNDSMTLSGSEAYQGALVFCSNVLIRQLRECFSSKTGTQRRADFRVAGLRSCRISENAAKVKTPNAGSIYEDLSSRFPGAQTKKKA